MLIVRSPGDAVDAILAHAGPHLVVAAPLGLGKPNELINALYQRIVADPSRTMTLYTALSLGLPRATGDLERRFLEPFVARHFGRDYPELAYLAALRSGRLPPNVHVHEFYFQSGAMLGAAQAQADYTSINYSHVARDLAASGINLVVQRVARRGEGRAATFSLGSNPDVILDLLDRMAAARQPRPWVVGAVCAEMPFLGGDAEVESTLFDLLLESADAAPPLFALPRENIDDVEHAIGLHASTLVRDGGTLQIGIGALSDALVQALLLRQRDNAGYRHVLGELGAPLAKTDSGSGMQAIGGVAPFARGLYGSSEMVMDGFMHLRRGGILVREVFDDIALQELLDSGRIGPVLRRGDARRLFEAGVLPPVLDADTLVRLVAWGLMPETVEREGETVIVDRDTRFPARLDDDAVEHLDTLFAGRRLRGGCYLRGGFLLGSRPFYDWLRALQGDDYAGLRMERISTINVLPRGREDIARVQRREARFFNTCMMATPLGAAVSDALEDGRVVSGVGGQHDFVTQAHELDDGRSILMLRSTRDEGGHPRSNMRWNYGHVTIPRHLRDIFVTEYGIADLRGRADADCVQAMLAITDARFQDGLVEAAVAAGKLPNGFRIPMEWRDNTPEVLRRRLAAARGDGRLPSWPFGSDFDAAERALLPALGWLRSASRTPRGKLRLAAALLVGGPPSPDLLARMGLACPTTWREYMFARLLHAALVRASRVDAAAGRGARL